MKISRQNLNKSKSSNDQSERSINFESIPTDRDNYISLDEYFNYLRIVRINELQRAAQSLGAKHFKVTYKEEQTSSSENKGKLQMKVVGIADSEGQHLTSEKK